MLGGVARDLSVTLEMLDELVFQEQETFLCQERKRNEPDAVGGLLCVVSLTTETNDEPDNEPRKTQRFFVNMANAHLRGVHNPRGSTNVNSNEDSSSVARQCARLGRFSCFVASLRPAHGEM